jgi:hypothetical protein
MSSTSTFPQKFRGGSRTPFNSRGGKPFRKNFNERNPESKLVNNNAEAKDGTVDFMNVNILKKKSVRGLLKKRAKKYDCKINTQHYLFL